MIDWIPLNASLREMCNYIFHNIEIKVITRENDPVNLRLHEAYYIRKYKPGLNSRGECAELNDLLF